MTSAQRWWQSGVIYQIYPRSFQDTDGDGIGDLEGIRHRLDYLAWLGVDAVWISPFYPSPMVDFGYDISDYTDVDPRFGDLAAFDRMLAEAHDRGLRIILDLVPNHTSDQHPWFTESRRSRSSPRRDWYLWRDPAPDGGPPNNWRSEFGGSAWALDPGTGQYYYHAFAEEQPDLNWRNREVREAIYDVMRFWLERGVDGFRVDVMWHMLKDEQFRDNPPNPDYREGEMSPYHEVHPTYSADQPEVHEVVAEMRAVLEEYDERLMIGELYLPVDRLIDYYGADGDGAHLPFNFHLISTPWTARDIEVVIDRYEGALPAHAWPNWVLGNPDQSRVASRIGAAQARVAAVLLLTLRGTPTIYYGDEIGMHDVEVPPERSVDVRERNVPGRGFGRDPQRTPMQWDGSPSGGFTTGQPWLPLPADVAMLNVGAQRDDPSSMLSLHRRLLELRRSEPALSVGDYAPLAATGSVLAYERRHEDRRVGVVLNLGSDPQPWPVPGDLRIGRTLLTASRAAAPELRGELRIPGDEAIVFELE
ncbi:MAG TPA: alpha-amylase family glycosyl hydrolase [Candidatus Limnocylindria bacterium]|nr:alpha-amylase family glycosyl hydrolase [Candidatus Limnocylindria bacterium]